jgi:hypothetical protein
MSSHVQEPKAVASVNRLSQRLPPFVVVQVPKHSFPKTGLECLECSPAQFFFDLNRINRIAPIVAGSIGNKADQLPSRGTARGKIGKIVKNIANGVYHLEICTLTTATNVVPAPYLPFSEDLNKGPDVILYVKPIANVASIAVNRKRLEFDGV